MQNYCQPCNDTKFVPVCFTVRTYHKIADKYLENLCFQTCSSRKQPLQDIDQEMPQRCANEGPIDSHFGHPRADVVTVLANILRDP